MGRFSIAHFSRLGYKIDDYPETKALFDKITFIAYESYDEERRGSIHLR